MASKFWLPPFAYAVLLVLGFLFKEEGNKKNFIAIFNAKRGIIIFVLRDEI